MRVVLSVDMEGIRTGEVEFAAELSG